MHLLVETEQDVLRRFARRPISRVLEAGCGRRSSRADSLAPRELGVRTVVGVDIDEDAGASNRGLDDFVAADLCARLPFPDAAFDLVYASFVVEHLSEPRAAFREWRRLLPADGAVLLVTSNLANPLMRVAAALPHSVRSKLKRLGPGVEARDVFRAPYLVNTPEALQRLAHGSGLVLSEIFYVATLHRYAGSRRKTGAVLLAFERLLPAPKRSTIVALLRPATSATNLAGAPPGLARRRSQESATRQSRFPTPPSCSS